MPRAFLIKRRYHEFKDDFTCATHFSNDGCLNVSPERNVRTADETRESKSKWEGYSPPPRPSSPYSTVSLSRALSTEIWEQILSPLSVYDVYRKIEPLGLLKKNSPPERTPKRETHPHTLPQTYLKLETPQPFSVIRRNLFYHDIHSNDESHNRMEASSIDSSNYENLVTSYSNDESNSSDNGSDDSSMALTVLDSHVCPECGKRYSTSSNLARHRQTHRSECDRKARKCPHCDKVYVSTPAYSMHVRTHSQGCQCPFCGKSFSRPWLLQGHIRTHTGEKPFKCPICAKAFADKSNLRAHIQTHSTSKPYVCSRCGKAFALKSYLYKHEESSCMRVHRNQANNSSRSGPTANLSVLQPISPNDRSFTILQLKA